MSPFIIAIDHNDNYLSQGLRYILINFFHRWKREVSFTSIEHKEYADLIIASEERIRDIRPCFNKHNPLKLITIRWDYGSRNEKRRICNTEVGSFSRSDMPEVLLRLVKLACAGKKDDAVSFRRCLCCSTALSSKERVVLQGVSEGRTLATMARNLNVSVQSISRYKRSAMEKLGFARDHELYIWFRLGGLDTISERFTWR
ncbi:hypothetical protein BJP35_2275 [Enterobacter sp. J49]|uniref:helix-turn-helix transcriptional regulator n=1 Tax=Enterobacter sp. J49 TaxID=1903627 RepID=UPI000A3B1AAA|nr:LuxR C-terminal-related transcriptional regulator [Enterobacter sp. J49]OUC37010.1 hypothetical protein BJP35_2275 [Enterobacter sp. J49]